MGVDHGLGGKDNKKSQQRREKKAKRTKSIAMKALHSGSKKKEVVFDEESRTEWLTGFHKRKQERRKFGLAMQILKDKKSHKDTIKEQRAVIKAAALHDRNRPEEKKRRGDKKKGSDSDSDNDGYDYDYIDDEGPDHGNEVPGAVIGGETLFVDEATTSMFGGAVSVIVDTGVADDLYDQNNPDMENYKAIDPHRFREKKILTKLEKAMKQVSTSGKMNRKSKSGGGSKGGGKFFEEKAGKGKGGKGKKAHSGKSLFHKALGSGALGSNTFKGKNKGKRS